MLIDWAVFDAYAEDEDSVALAAGLLALDDSARRALCADLADKITANVRWFRGKYIATEFYGLAVIACAPSAARAATMLSHREMRDWHEIRTERFLEIARARQLGWTGDLGVRLARRLPARGADSAGDWLFVSALLEEGKAEPPVTEGVVRSWLTAVLGDPSGDVAGRLRTLPFLDLLLPGVFEIDGLGSEISLGGWVNGSWHATPRFPRAVAELTGQGRLDRARILGATVDRLVRGDRPAHLRPFAMLHAALRPTATELAGHAPGYARMLSEAPSPVATLAQQALRAVDEAGLLEPATLLEASAPALLRREKAIVKAQLAWLDRVARRTPERAGEILTVVAEALHHPAIDIRERALTVLGRHLPHVAAESAEHARIAEVVLAVPGDPGARAAAMFGVVPTAETPVVAALAPAPPVAAMPPPIRSAGELAEEVAALVHDQTAVRWERVLAGLVALQPTGLGEAFGPLLDRYPVLFQDVWGRNQFLGAAIRAAIGLDIDFVMRERLRASTRADLTTRLHTPTGVLTYRVAEIAAGLAGAPLPLLLATPTHVTGSIDAPVLVERLARLEAAGLAPWPLDLQQALLRAPRDPGPEALAAAESLTSPAGRQLAAWLRSGGLPDPVSTRFEQCTRDRAGNVVVRRIVATLESARDDDAGISLEDAVVSLTHRQRPDYQAGYAHSPDILAMMVPHHREIAAAWALPGIAALADQDDRDASLLPLLAEAAGPIGPAMTTALAYGFGARHQNDRAAAVDAFLLLAAAARPPAAPAAERPAELRTELVAADRSRSAAHEAPPAVSGPPPARPAGDRPTATAPDADEPSADTVPPGGDGTLARGDGTPAGGGDEPPADARPADEDRPLTGTGLADGDGRQAGGGNAARGFASGVGAELADLCSDGTVKLSRVVPALADAFEAGAAVAVWETLRAALPPLLPATPRSLPDLLELATRVATATGACDDIPGLAAVGARGGGSRVVREAKRLHTTLTGGMHTTSCIRP